MEPGTIIETGYRANSVEAVVWWRLYMEPVVLRLGIKATRLREVAAVIETRQERGSLVAIINRAR